MYSVGVGARLICNTARAHNSAARTMSSAQSSACNASLEVAKRSGCPAGRWQDVIAPLLASTAKGRNLTFVNVGANKGYNVAEFMQRFHFQRYILTSPAWHEELMKSSPSKGVRVRFGCGLCNACKARPPRAKLHRPVEVHAIEMVRLNANALQRLFGVFKIPGTVHHLAMSNYSGIAEYRQAGAIGLEHFELGKDVTKYKSERVGCLTLDNFASMHLPPPKRSFLGVASPRIDLLSVDAEGQDALILEGAEELLSKRSVAVLEFEYIMRGYWRYDKGADRRHLGDVLARLEKFGYRCYWQGESGSLAHASGPYWCDAFAFRLRSNLVCSHRPDVLRAFEGLCAA